MLQWNNYSTFSSSYTWEIRFLSNINKEAFHIYIFIYKFLSKYKSLIDNITSYNSFSRYVNKYTIRKLVPVLLFLYAAYDFFFQVRNL